MKTNKRILFSVVLVLIISLTFGCSNNSSSVPKKNIEEFLNKKSELYEEQKSLVDSFYEQYKEVKLDEILKDIKKLLVKYTEKLYSKKELKLEKIHENEFTLEKIDNNWLISYIK